MCCSPRGHKESDTTEQLNNGSSFALCRWTTFYPFTRQVTRAASISHLL